MLKYKVMANIDIRGFFRDISNFLSFKKVLGVDIGTTSMKVVEVERAGGQLNLKNYGILETKDYLIRANEAIQTSALKIVEGDAARLLKALLKEVRPGTRKAIASVPLFSVFMVPLEMPRLSPEETSKAITYQAKQYIPIPVSEVSLDWVKIDEFNNQKGQPSQRILITALPNDIVRRYRNIFRAAGLSLAALEVDIQALARILTKPADGTTIIVDIGSESTTISVVEQGLVKQTAQTDYGGLTLTNALSRTLDISVFRAEELKRRRGLLGSGGEYELSTSLMPFLDVIIQECERAKNVYERNYGRKVERGVLVGGGANLPGIHDYFTSQMKLPFYFARPLERFRYSRELEPLVKTLNNELALALGLALRVYNY